MRLILYTRKTEWRWLWNWPVFAWLPSYQCWRYTPDIDDRKSYSRTRWGPFRFDVVRWW